MRKSGKRKAESGRGKAESGKRKADGACFQLSAFSFQLSGRGGFTLLEVLVSIFVLLFGLLAVAAVIPIAGLRILQTKQADQAAACGQSAMRDVRVRRMVEPRNWLRYNAGIPAFAAVPPTPGDLPAIPFPASFAIDPLGFANDALDGTVENDMSRFPYYVPVWNPLAGTGMVTMNRVSLDRRPDLSGIDPMQFDLADRIFTWYDDLQIPVPADPGARAVAVGDPPGNYWQTNVWQTEGKYSWLATVTPEVTTPDPGAGAAVYIDRHRTYRVSVVVFYNRDFSTPSAPLDPDKPGERMVRAEVLSGGYGGGDVRLFLPPPPLPGSTASGSYLDVKKGEWLMLCGWDRDPDRNGDPTDTPGRGIFRWYRVISAGEDPQQPSGIWERYVTLAGPDWSAVWCPDYDGNGVGGMDLTGDGIDEHVTDAALFTRVIGVYTTTIELDEPGSVWGG